MKIVKISHLLKIYFINKYILISNQKIIFYSDLYLNRFADKQLRLLRLKAARAQLEEKCVKALEKYKQRDKLVFYIFILYLML